MELTEKDRWLIATALRTWKRDVEEDMKLFPNLFNPSEVAHADELAQAFEEADTTILS